MYEWIIEVSTKSNPLRHFNVDPVLKTDATLQTRFYLKKESHGKSRESSLYEFVFSILLKVV